VTSPPHITNPWAGRMAAIPDQLRALRTGRSTEDREALILLWRTLAEADVTVQEAYRGFSEAELLARAAELRLDAPDWGFAPDPTDSLEALVGKVAAHLRALEHLIADTDTGSRPPNPEAAWIVATGGEPVFLVPTPRFRWAQPPRPEDDFRVFDRRGLTRLRVIPRRIGEANVRLCQPPAMQPPRETLGFGGALIPGMRVDFQESDNRVTAVSTQAPNMEEVLRSYVARAHGDKCFALVFPELSIDPTGLAVVKNALLDRAWDRLAAERHYLSVVVAGSWHQATEAGYVNEAAVLSGSGRPLLGQQKRLPWRDRAKTENIQRGEDLWILVLGDLLVGFGICLDFCERLGETPYRALDVDLVLVPSLGNDTTMSGHAVVAQGLQINRGARCFVVQAADPALQGFDGYILPPEVLRSTDAEGFRRAGFTTHFTSLQAFMP
jgi:hypothetical protein